MSRYEVPEMSCDDDHGCDATTPDFYECTADSVDGIKITATQRAPGWFSTLDADYCPQHLPWLRNGECDDDE